MTTFTFEARKITGIFKGYKQNPIKKPLTNYKTINYIVRKLEKRDKKKIRRNSDLSEGCLNSNLFLDYLFAAVVTTFRTNSVEFGCSTAIGTGSQGRSHCFVVGSALIPSCFRMFVLRMCHYYLILIIIQQFF